MSEASDPQRPSEGGTAPGDAERPYVLGTDDHELARLALQQRVWAAQTERWLDALELRPGAAVLDAGCGPGYVSELLARRVGPGGQVLAVDESERWIAHLTKRLAATAGERPEHADRIRPRHLRLEELDPERLGLDPRAGLDAVFVRWVLSFPKDPGAILARLASLLKPGGRLVAVDYNHEGVSLFPPSRGFRAVVDATRALYASAGGDAFVAGRFPALFAQAGLGLESITPHAICGGPGTPAFEWADTFWTYHCHPMEAQGFLAPEDKRRFLAEWEERRRDPTAIFFSPLVVEAVGVRAPSSVAGRVRSTP